MVGKGPGSWTLLAAGLVGLWHHQEGLACESWLDPWAVVNLAQPLPWTSLSL